jgi:uncharacterized membrane protein
MNQATKQEIFDWTILLLGIGIIFLAALKKLGAIYCLPVAAVFFLQFYHLKILKRKKEWRESHD